LRACLEPRHPAEALLRVDAQNRHPNCYFAEFATHALARAVIVGLQGVVPSFPGTERPSHSTTGLFFELSNAAKNGPPCEREDELYAGRKGIDKTGLYFARFSAGSARLPRLAEVYSAPVAFVPKQEDTEKAVLLTLENIRRKPAAASYTTCIWACARRSAVFHRQSAA
jgi:hypothetical protein